MALVPAFSLFACGEDPVAPDATVASVQILHDALTVVAFEDLALVAVAANASDQPLSDVQVAWSVGDTSIARVNEAGVVHGVSVGETQLVATAGEYADTATLTVISPLIASLRLSVQDTLVLGEEGTTTITAEPLDAQGRVVRGVTVTWGVSDLAVASVSADGEVTANGIGDAQLVARVGGAISRLPLIVTTGFVKMLPMRFNVCALRVNGVVYCWAQGGSASLGVLGRGANEFPRDSAAPIAGSRQYVDLVAGEYSSCATTASQAVFCWGPNYDGLLGTGDTLVHATPTPVAGGILFSSIAMGEQHSCGIATDGKTYCWGDDYFGVLGYRTPEDVWTPRPLEQVFEQVSTSAWGFTCGLDAAGKPYCWGSRSHFEPQFASDHCDEANCYEPVRIGAPSTAYVQLSVAYRHACGLTAAGKAECWGEGQRNVLAVSSASSFVRLSESTVGASATCGITESGDAEC